MDWTNIVTFLNAASTTKEALSGGTSSFYETYKTDSGIIGLTLTGFSFSSISTGMCPKESTSFTEMIASSVALERDSVKKNTDDARSQALAVIYDGFVKFLSSTASFNDDLMASLDLWRLHSHCYFVLEEPLVVNGTMLEPTIDKCISNEASVIIQYLEEDRNNDLTVLSMFIQLSSCGVNKDNISSPQKWRLESIQSFTGTVNKGLVPFSTIEKKLEGRLDLFAQNTEPLSVPPMNSMEIVTDLTAGNCPREHCGKKGGGSSNETNGAVSKDFGKGIVMSLLFALLLTILV
ncbi:predicted protein [Chaetoceros tenuissimus]|uniref:Uncharacterized protein n=1 Tax=Chaetoceros tenuissimus TaxID=426638 RepID=A0AAD3HG19_9STRA|nr:predicted protein [Chaetoceros tenuissimus]